MYIQSLNITYDNQIIISDVDDCILRTSASIRAHGLRLRQYYYNQDIKDEYMASVTAKSILTGWGNELINMVSDGAIRDCDYTLLTAMAGRGNLLTDRLGIDNIIEGMEDWDKITYLNGVNKPCIYVDDKLTVINGVDNPNVTCINYPSSFPF
jgi:hypothetical protein